MEKRKEKNRLFNDYLYMFVRSYRITLHTRVHVLHDCDIIIGERD